MSVRKKSNNINSLLFLLFLFSLLMGLPVLPLLHAQQVRELDRKDKWVLLVRDVPIDLPPDYKPSQEEAEGAFESAYQVLILKTPEGQRHELPLTNKGMFPEEITEEGSFFPFQKARFDRDWNKDGIPEIILSVQTPAFNLKTGRTRPTEGNAPNYILVFQAGYLHVVGVLGSESGFSGNVYPAVLPRPQEKWSEILHWTIDLPDKPVWRDKERGLDIEINFWRVSRYAFSAVTNRYEPRGNWAKKGFASVEDLNRYSTDLLKDKDEYSGPPTAYMQDDKVFLRDQDNQQAKKLGLLREGTSFYLLTMHGPSVEIGDALGPWFKVLVQSGPLKGQVGWVYGAFITPWKMQKIQALTSEQDRELDHKDNWVLSVRDVPVALATAEEIAGSLELGWSAMPSFQILILKSPTGETHELKLTDKTFFKREVERDMLFYPLKKASFIEDRNKDGIPEIMLTIVSGGYYLQNGISVPTDHNDVNYWITFQPGNSLLSGSFQVTDASGKEAGMP